MVLAGNVLGSVGGLWDLIDEIELTASALSIDFTNIPAKYRHLYLFYMLRTDKAGIAYDNLSVTFNGDTGNNYDMLAATWYHNSQYATADYYGQASLIDWCMCSAVDAPANAFSNGYMIIPYYAKTTFSKSCSIYNGLITNTSSPGVFKRDANGIWRSTAAINRITWTTQGADDFVANSIISLYGIK